MNLKFPDSLVVCGTLCILSTLGIAAYLIKQLSPMVRTAIDGHIQSNQMLLVSVAGIPGVATFIVGVVLLAIGLKRCVGRGDTKGNE